MRIASLGTAGTGWRYDDWQQAQVASAIDARAMLHCLVMYDGTIF